MRIFTIILVVVLAWLQFNLWWGKNGVKEYLQIHASVAAGAVANEKLAQRNERMYAEIDDLKQGLEAIEERARNELGMIKPDETFFRIVND